MADVLLQRNDEAYQRVGFVAKQVAQRLQFDYIRWHGSHDWFAANNTAGTSTSHTGPSGRLFRALPHAFGLFAVQDNVRLFCRTSMSMKLLAEHIKEQLVVDEIEVEGTQITITHEQLVRQSLYLPNSLDLVLEHIELCEDIPQMNTELAAWKRFEIVSQEEGLIEAQELSTLYRRTYLQVREWAHRVGILSGDCRFLSEDLLASCYTDGFFECLQDVLNFASSPWEKHELFHSIVKSSSFAKLSNQHYNRRGNKSSESQIPQQHRIAIEKAIEKAAPPTDGVDKWTIDALDAFAANHFVFIKVQASNWGVRDQGKLAQHRFVRKMRALMVRLQDILDEVLEDESDNGYATTIFPELSQSTNHVDDLIFLIGLSRPPNSLLDTVNEAADNEAAVAAQIAAENVVQGDFFAGLNAIMQHQIISEASLRQELRDMHAIALNLPAVFRLHLDYIPLSDPLFEEEVQSHETTALTSEPQPQESEKLRTSREVLNRLQWDTKHASNRYEIGYKDRFEKDLMWKPLEDWTKDEQAEDFIPMHRIYQFRDIASKGVVWDRDMRIDRT